MLKTAFILCAGYGSRMGALTQSTPKPMLPVNGKPLVSYTISHLQNLGITDIIINLHFFPEQITGYFGDGSAYGVHIRYSYEEKPLGTAGAVRYAEPLLTTESFLVIYGDVITNTDFHALDELRRAHNATAAIFLHKRAKSNSFVKTEADGKITCFLERPEVTPPDDGQSFVNSGLYCFSSNIFNYLPPPKVFCDFPKEIFPELSSRGQLYGLPLTGYRKSIDTPQRLDELCRDLHHDPYWRQNTTL